jgi:hypothetical protein
MNIDHTEIMECEFEKNSSKKIIRSKYVKWFKINDEGKLWYY